LSALLNQTDDEIRTVIDAAANDSRIARPSEKDVAGSLKLVNAARVARLVDPVEAPDNGPGALLDAIGADATLRAVSVEALLRSPFGSVAFWSAIDIDRL
jgi:hypothetical protein